jgi:hypothetical protein
MKELWRPKGRRLEEKEKDCIQKDKHETKRRSLQHERALLSFLKRLTLCSWVKQLSTKLVSCQFGVHFLVSCPIRGL